MVLFSSGLIGGAERSITRMVLASNALDVHYALATAGANSTWAAWARSEGLEVESFEIFESDCAKITGLKALWRFVRGWRPTIVYAVGLRAAFLARLLRLVFPRFRVVHAIRSTYPKGSMLAKSFALSERCLKWFTDFYIANSRRGALDIRAIAGVPEDKIRVIHNGVVVGQPVQVAVLRLPVVAIVANITPYKGHVEFLRALVPLAQRRKDFRLWLIGRNELGLRLEEVISEHGLSEIVEYKGFSEVPTELMAHVRVVALPSPQIEGCPTVLLEAMGMGIPVVAFDVGGIAELVENGRHGFLAAQGDYAALITSIETLLFDVELNDLLGAQARDRVKGEFSLDRCAHRHAEVWRYLSEKQYE